MRREHEKRSRPEKAIKRLALGGKYQIRSELFFGAERNSDVRMYLRRGHDREAITVHPHMQNRNPW